VNGNIPLPPSALQAAREFDLFYELSMPPRCLPAARRSCLPTRWRIGRSPTGSAFTPPGWWSTTACPATPHASKPELFLAAAASAPKRLRLGLGIGPLPYHHPLTWRNGWVTLDLLSGGRVEFGIGRGFRAGGGYAAFAVAMADSRARTEEALRIVRSAWRAERPA